MDLALAPKLLAASLIGTAVVARPHSAPAEVVNLKLEWVASGKDRSAESVSIRATAGSVTTVEQNGRTIQVNPQIGDGGAIQVELKVVDAKKRGDSIQADVRSGSGETVTVMATTHKEGKASQERLFFLTATPN